ERRGRAVRRRRAPPGARPRRDLHPARGGARVPLHRHRSAGVPGDHQPAHRRRTAAAMKKILVTGAGGWLGAEIVRTLLARGDAVIAADLVIGPALAKIAAGNARVSTAVADLGEWHQVARLFEQHRPDAVV